MNRSVSVRRKMKRAAAFYLIVFLAVILLISLYINNSSFKSQIIGNELSLSSISAGRLVDNLENGLLYGKSLDNFYGIGGLFQSWAKENVRAVDVRLLSPDQKDVYYQLADPASYENRETDDSILLPIKDEEGTLQGYLNVVVDLRDSLAELSRTTGRFLLLTAFLLAAGAAAAAVFSIRGGAVTEEGTLSRRRILTFMFALILALQLVFTAYSYTALKDFCTALSESTGEEVRALIQADIDKVMNQGVAFQQIHGFDEYAREVIEQTPLIERIDLTERGVDVVLDVEVSQEYIRQSIRKMLVDMLTVLVTSMFIAAEIVNYMIISINRKTERISGERVYDKLLAIRVSSFLIHVACYLPISFIPAMMNRLTGGAASDFILGLPVNIFFVTGFISTLLAGGWCLRLGWKRLLYLGVELLVLSSLMAGMIQHAAVLVLARGIYGAAYALIYVAIRDFAAATEDREERSKGLSQVTAGLYAGITIGAVVGSMIFDSIGFLGVFCVSAALGCVSFLIVKLYCLDESLPDASAPVLGKAAPAAVEAAAEEAVKTSAAVPASRIAVPGGRRFGTAADRSESSAADKRRLREEKRLERRQSRGVLLQVVKNRDMLRISLFVIVPLAVSALYFDYFLPVYSVKAGIASSDVGRAFLVNGLAVAYIAPLMVKYVSSRLSERINLVLFTVLMGLGFVSFGVLGGLAGILAAAAIMGVAEGTALVSQNMIMLDLPIAKEVGSSRMLSIYATIRKLAQTVGPQIFALFMLIGYRPGMAAFGLVIGICSVLFLASSRGRGKGEG